MRNVINNKIASGLCMGMTWGDAIRHCLKHPDCDVIEVEVYKNPNNLLDDERVFSHYSLIAYESRRTYKKKIPKTLYYFVKDLLNEQTTT
jgi:hypothetical protein